MCDKKNVTSTFELNLKVAWGALAIVCIVVNVLGHREGALLMGTIISMFWVLTRMVVEALDAVAEAITRWSTKEGPPEPPCVP